MPGLSVVAKNSDVLGRCNFTLQSVNAAAGTAQVRLAGNAQPASFAGYYQNAYTVVHCRVYGGYASFSPLLTQIDPYANGPIVPTTSENAVIARYTNYTVCAYAYVKKNDGSDSQTFLYCATA